MYHGARWGPAFSSSTQLSHRNRIGDSGETVEWKRETERSALGDRRYRAHPRPIVADPARNILGALARPNSHRQRRGPSHDQFIPEPHLKPYRDLTQQWARAICEDQPAAGKVEGIHYRSAYRGGRAPALWDCVGEIETDKRGLPLDLPLDHDRGCRLLLKALQGTGIPVTPGSGRGLCEVFSRGVEGPSLFTAEAACGRTPNLGRTRSS